MTNYNDLTPEEQRIIVLKGTERPFTGKYVYHKEEGTYLCKRCDTPLFSSEAKFESGCGWPSFDKALKGAVLEMPDKDGIRTEIVCANCGGHLGHVFYNEGFTDENTRHCVNSISLLFKEKEVESLQTQRAIFASGCFWGTEYHFQRVDGVISTTVGYTGGDMENPTYRQVCAGVTGHAEAVEVIFDPNKVTYETLVKLFFETHDPTQVNRQGPDVGHQYRTAIFYLNQEQKSIAENLIQQLESQGYAIATEVSEASTFWKAEDYHQDYYEKNLGQPYCHVYTKRF